MIIVEVACQHATVSSQELCFLLLNKCKCYCLTSVWWNEGNVALVMIVVQFLILRYVVLGKVNKINWKEKIFYIYSMKLYKEVKGQLKV